MLLQQEKDILSTLTNKKQDLSFKIDIHYFLLVYQMVISIDNQSFLQAESYKAKEFDNNNGSFS